MTLLTDLEWVGGHPLIDFVNTELILQGERVNLLSSAAAYGAWLHHMGLIEAQPDTAAMPNAVLTIVTDFRQEMRQMLQTIVDKHPLTPHTIGIINHALAQRHGRAELIPQENGGFTLSYRYVFEQAESWLAPLADAAADLLTTADFERVKRCDNPECIRYFLDESRNRSRRWCSMEGCGNRLKARSFYHRHNQ